MLAYGPWCCCQPYSYHTLTPVVKNHCLFFSFTWSRKETSWSEIVHVLTVKTPRCVLQQALSSSLTSASNLQYRGLSWSWRTVAVVCCPSVPLSYMCHCTSKAMGSMKCQAHMIKFSSLFSDKDRRTDTYIVRRHTVILQIFGALKFRWRAIAERSVSFKFRRP